MAGSRELMARPGYGLWLTLVSGRGKPPYPGPPLTTYDRQPGWSRQAMIAPAPGEAPRTTGGLFGIPHVCWNGSSGWTDMLHPATVVLGDNVASPAARAPARHECRESRCDECSTLPGHETTFLTLPVHSTPFFCAHSQAGRIGCSQASRESPLTPSNESSPRALAPGLFSSDCGRVSRRSPLS